MGKSQSAISNKLRLLTLPEEVQEALLNSEISERHARSLLTVQNIEKQKALLQEVIKNKIPVRILDEMIKKENEGNNMNNNENINNPNLVTQPVNGPVNPNFLYDGNVNQQVSVENNSETNLGSMISESMNINSSLNTETVNNPISTPLVSTPVVNNEFSNVSNIPPVPNGTSENLQPFTTSPVQNQQELLSKEGNNLVANIPMPLDTNQQALEQINPEVVASNEVQDNRLNINTEEINKEIDKIMNNTEQKNEVSSEKESSDNSFDLDRFKKVDYNSEIKQTISGEEVIGEGLLAGKPVEEEKQPVPEETVIIETVSNVNIPINNTVNGQVLISQTGGMVLPINQEIGEVSTVSTEPNENIKKLINSQDLKLALIGIGNVINNLKARGIEVKEVRKTYSDHLELTLEIKKN